METLVIIMSIVFPAFVIGLAVFGAFKWTRSRQEEKQKHEREKLIMRQVIAQKNESISRLGELIEE